MSYGFIIVFCFFRILHFRKKICLPIFAGLFISISEFKIWRNVSFFIIFSLFCIPFWWKVWSFVNCRLLGMEWTGADSMWRRVVSWSGSNATGRWMCSSQSNKCDKIDLNLSVTWSVVLFWKLRRLFRIYEV